MAQGKNLPRLPDALGLFSSSPLSSSAVSSSPLSSSSLSSSPLSSSPLSSLSSLPERHLPNGPSASPTPTGSAVLQALEASFQANYAHINGSAPADSSLSGNLTSLSGLTHARLVPRSLAASSAAPASGFIGRRSHHVKLERCNGLEVFLVSNLPTDLAARYPAFAAREAEEGHGLPVLHHVHLDEPASASADNVAVQEKMKSRPVDRDTVANPRLVVEHSQVTPLWNVTEPENREGLPVIRIAEGAASVFRMSAPVVGLGDMLSALLEMPVMNVEIHADYSIALSYRLNAAEGREIFHSHVDPKHRPIADLDIQYLKCRDPLADELEVGLEEAKKHALMVNVTLWTHACAPVSFYWKVVCAGNDRHLQPPAHGVHMGTTQPAQMKLGQDRDVDDAASGDWAASGLRDASRRHRLKLMTQLEGDLVADGSSAPGCADVRRPQVEIPKDKNSMDFFVWCKGCTGGKVTMQLPSIAADLDVVYPIVHHFHSANSREERDRDASTPGIIPPSHVTVVDVKEGQEDRDVHHFRIDFNCKAEATVDSVFKDPVCATGIASPDGTACCASKCGVCGGEQCHERPGTVDECCVTYIHARQRPCAFNPPPCVLRSLNEDAAAARVASALQISQQTRGSSSFLSSLLQFALFAFWLLLYGILLLLVLLYLYTVLHRLVILRLPLGIALLPTVSQLIQTAFLGFGALRHLYLSKLQALTPKRHAYTSFDAPSSSVRSSSWMPDLSIFQDPARTPQFIPLSSLSSADYLPRETRRGPHRHDQGRDGTEEGSLPAGVPRVPTPGREGGEFDASAGAEHFDDFEYGDL
ncbi:conserved hypothetical protein [Neospora caninum Liverpool]|uniref:Transmembrane protein n=1 Tax=Neospora caninum (strain Liverpool) TaxID=572307 RepID=F0V899_NEOCL|nr:conserved hypothetical protein [Neospora caninum Liverpool]CBZ49940.1 conserved hypothetical protein [Neospora caninum Liverpool]|eukprot:XP_003879975.1 conserved hypothetical protein [Neospora caninum Liverpool]